MTVMMAPLKNRIRSAESRDPDQGHADTQALRAPSENSHECGTPYLVMLSVIYRAWMKSTAA